MLCGPRCSHLSTILNNIVEPESGVTILFNVVDSYEQCGQQNIVQSCFHINIATTWGRLYKTLNHFFNHYFVVK
jgi:hypothetical protein